MRFSFFCLPLKILRGTPLHLVGAKVYYSPPIFGAKSKTSELGYHINRCFLSRFVWRKIFLSPKMSGAKIYARAYLVTIARFLAKIAGYG
jgi:hypothetical protein